MNSTPHFQRQQRQFLQYLRQPKSSPLPDGFAPERVSIYSKLLYNKFDESLSACFPVLTGLLPAAEWRMLVLDFIATHRCATPYYRRIPEEFVHYLQQERSSLDNRPYIAEMAHFEWIELELSVRESGFFENRPIQPEQLLAENPVFAPVSELLHYHWPVQSISRDHQPLEANSQPSYILGFRDANDLVQFVSLNPMSAQLVALLSSGLSGRQALDRLGAGLDKAAFQTFKQLGLDAIMELHHRGAIIDTRPALIPGDD